MIRGKMGERKKTTYLAKPLEWYHYHNICNCLRFVCARLGSNDAKEHKNLQRTFFSYIVHALHFNSARHPPSSISKRNTPKEDRRLVQTKLSISSKFKASTATRKKSKLKRQSDRTQNIKRSEKKNDGKATGIDGCAQFITIKVWNEKHQMNTRL